MTEAHMHSVAYSGVNEGIGHLHCVCAGCGRPVAALVDRHVPHRYPRTLRELHESSGDLREDSWWVLRTEHASSPMRPSNHCQKRRTRFSMLESREPRWKAALAEQAVQFLPTNLH